MRGTPDHGAAWSRPWAAEGTEESVRCPDFAFTRRISQVDGSVVAAYRLTAEPGFRFVWAAHALLELSQSAVIHAPAGTPTRLFPEAAALLESEWPAGAPWLAGAWPVPLGLRLDTCGPDDGTAVGAVLLDCPSARVADGPDLLTMRLEADGLPTSVALWRQPGRVPGRGAVPQHRCRADDRPNLRPCRGRAGRRRRGACLRYGRVAAGTRGAQEATMTVEGGRTAKEAIRVQGQALVDKVKELIHEGNVRRLVIKNAEGHTVMEIPVTAGVIAVVAAPIVTAVGAIAALTMEWKIEVERTKTEPDDSPPA